MNQVKLLRSVIGDIRSLADHMQALADTMEDQEIINTEKPKKEELVHLKEVTLEEVRMVLADKSRSGKTVEVKELIATFGVEKLSDIDKSNYAEVLKKAEVL